MPSNEIFACPIFTIPVIVDADRSSTAGELFFFCPFDWNNYNNILLYIHILDNKHLFFIPQFTNRIIHYERQWHFDNFFFHSLWNLQR